MTVRRCDARAERRSGEASAVPHQPGRTSDDRRHSRCQRRSGLTRGAADGRVAGRSDRRGYRLGAAAGRSARGRRTPRARPPRPTPADGPDGTAPGSRRSTASPKTTGLGHHVGPPDRPAAARRPFVYGGIDTLRNPQAGSGARRSSRRSTETADKQLPVAGAPGRRAVGEDRRRRQGRRRRAVRAGQAPPAVRARARRRPSCRRRWPGTASGSTTTRRSGSGRPATS